MVVLRIMLVMTVGVLVVMGQEGSHSSPVEVHISLSGVPGEIFVTWVSWVAPGEAAVVVDGLGTTAASCESYEVVTGWPGHVCSALVAGLAPGARLSYKVRSGGVESRAYELLVPAYPPAGDAFSVAFFGDMDYGTESDGTLSLLTARRAEYEFAVHMGDIGYTSLSGSRIGVNATRLDLFFEKIVPFASARPYLVAPGNQEYFYKFWEYEHRWQSPVQGNLYYSFDYGGCHFVAISTEHDLTEGSAQYQWLEADLARATGANFVVVYGHRPMYCSNSPLDSGWFADCYLTGPALRRSLEPLLRQYGVDLYLAGHMHDAEVTYPVRNGAVRQTSWKQPPANSITQVVAGYAGNREGFNGFNANFTPDWSAWRQADRNGYLVLTVVNASRLHLEFLGAPSGDVLFELDYDRTPAGTEGAGTGAGEEEGEDAAPFFPPAGTTALAGSMGAWLGVAEMESIAGLPAEVQAFAVGLFEGIGDEYGSIQADIANWEAGITYDVYWTILLTEQAFADPTETNRQRAQAMWGVTREDLRTLVAESGGVRFIKDVAVLANYYELNGGEAFFKLELLKFARHSFEISAYLHNGQIMLENAQYEQAGVYFGRILALLVKPLPFGQLEQE